MSDIFDANTYGSFFFMNSFTDKMISVENNPTEYYNAYFNGLNEMDLLFQNVFEPNSDSLNYEKFVIRKPEAKIFYEESRKIKMHGDYCYRPLKFRNKIIGFYGHVLHERGKSLFGNREQQLYEMMEPYFYNGIIQAVMKEKANFHELHKDSNNKFAAIFIYPGNQIEIPTGTNLQIISEILQIDTLTEMSIYHHPLIQKLLNTLIISRRLNSSISIDRDGKKFTLRATVNGVSKRHGYKFITMICFEQDSEVFLFSEFASTYNLTKKEIKIVMSLAEGKSNKCISEMYFISEATVKKHLSNIYEKTKCNNRTQLILSLTSIQ